MKRQPVDKSQLAHGFQGVTKRPEYLAWLKTLPCIVCGVWETEPAHLRLRKGPGTGAGTSQKNDRYALPLCRPCHDEQHRTGERVFWAGKDPHAMCDRLWAKWELMQE